MSPFLLLRVSCCRAEPSTCRARTICVTWVIRMRHGIRLGYGTRAVAARSRRMTAWRHPINPLAPEAAAGTAKGRQPPNGIAVDSSQSPFHQHNHLLPEQNPPGGLPGQSEPCLGSRSEKRRASDRLFIEGRLGLAGRVHVCVGASEHRGHATATDRRRVVMRWSPLFFPPRALRGSCRDEREEGSSA